MVALKKYSKKSQAILEVLPLYSFIIRQSEILEQSLSIVLLLFPFYNKGIVSHH